jgi:hypothetical protein
MFALRGLLNADFAAPAFSPTKYKNVMSNYNMGFVTETLYLIPGNTPRDKQHNLIEILRILQEIAKPRRGTEEETKTLQDFADEITRLNLLQ